MEEARGRALSVDPADMREKAPECFQAWFSGELRPCGLTEEIDRAGFTRERLAEIVLLSLIRTRYGGRLGKFPEGTLRRLGRHHRHGKGQSGINSALTTEYYDIFVRPDRKSVQPPAQYLCGHLKAGRLVDK